MIDGRKHLTRTLWTISVLAAACAAWAQIGGPGVVLIKDATILTVSHGNIPKGSILIRGGKIAEVGAGLTAPAGATVIEAAGQFVTPGIIDPHSHIAVTGGINEGTLAVTSMVAIEDVLDPTDINIYRELAGGVTTTLTMHGSANPIGGTNAVIKLRWGKDAKGLLFQGAKPTLKFALGENVKRSGPNPTRYPGTRMGTEDVIREAFIEARNYMRRWDEYKKRAEDKTAIPPVKDLKLEPLVEVLRGERATNVHGYRADEMLMMIRLADEFGFKVNSLEHGLEAYKIAKEVIAHGAIVSTFADSWGYKAEAWDAIPYNAAIITRKGGMACINSDSAERARRLNQEAARTMKYGGLNEQEALALITLNPAKELLIDSRVGTIEPGKDADLVIWNRHPLSVYAVAQATFIDGEIYFDIQKDREMRKRMEEERKNLEALDKKNAPQGRGRGSAPEGSIDKNPRHVE